MDVMYRSAAIADGTGPELVLDQSVLVEDDRIAWIGPDDSAPPPAGGIRVIDAGGATIVPGMVDAHSHTVLPGGSHWIDRISDTTEELLVVAEENGELALRSGVRWLRDVGSPQKDDRALALRVRDAWAGRRDRPYIRAAGTWIARKGVLQSIAIEVDDADGLVAAVERQIGDGSDLVKLYLDGPDPDMSPWTAGEVERAVAVAHHHNVRVTAHATRLSGARTAVGGGVHCIEHGFELDGDVVVEMADRGTFLVSTLAVLESWETFAATTRISRFTEPEGRATLEERRESGLTSVALAHRAGVRIAAGTDFGGGSLRANQMAWEVERLVVAGLEPWEAVAAATRVGGDLLGEPGAGRLEAGGAADFFLVHGNPLADPQALWRVWRVS